MLPEGSRRCLPEGNSLEESSTCSSVLTVKHRLLSVAMSQESDDIIRDQAAGILESGVLGRSRSYRRLFEYLVENTLAGRTPKEIEIAVEVFSRDRTFDPAQDSMVRVYAHNLRQKIRQYYETHGSEEAYRLSLPRGEYRLDVSESNSDVEADVRPWPGTSAFWIALPALTAVIGLALGYLFGGAPFRSVAEPTMLWQALADDDLPVTVVVGDYYIFGELDESGDVMRFVREFSVNSADDLDAFSSRSESPQRRYQDLELTYLAHSSAPALGDVLGVLYGMGKDVDVVPMSGFDPADVRSSHIVYIGYFSALDKLFDFTFAASDLAIGATYDELINIETGEFFASSAGRPSDYRDYRDYGYFSTFPGPAGNQFVIVAGTRDEGVMHIAQVVSDPAYVESVVQAVPQNADGAFELLYEVTGFDRTFIDAMLVHAAPLDGSRIWLGAAVSAAGQK